MSLAHIPVVPDDWTVWAFSDAHGVTSGFVEALARAGLIDHERHWVAPPRTALIGCGDYIDRGRDIAGLLGLMQRLEVEASAAGSVAHFALGNHEVLPLMIADGAHDMLQMWLEYGGTTTLEAYGCSTYRDREPVAVAAELDAAAPGLFGWLAGLPQAVRWRDVLFVHGGLVPGFGPDDLGRRTDEHLWIRDSFYEAAWATAGFETYEAAGIERVVFGHTPWPDGPREFHGGRSIDIDTNAVGNPDLPADSRRAFTLLGLNGDDTFAHSRLISIDTAAAPEGSPAR